MVPFDIHGRGEPVVVLHGTPVPPESVAPIVEALSRSHRVIVPHLDGIGVGPVEARARLEQTLLSVDVRRAAIVGHSYGAYHAFHLAASGVVEVSRLVALAPIAFVPSEMRAAHLALADQVKQGGVDLAAALLGAWFPAEFVRANPDVEPMVRRWFDAMSPASIQTSIHVELDAIDLRPLLPRVNVPVYLRIGRNDLATPPAFAEEIAALLPDATLEIIEGVGHFGHFEERDACVATVSAFVAGGAAA